VWPPEDYAGLAQVVGATETRIALGENESTLYGFREIVERRAGDICSPASPGGRHHGVQKDRGSRPGGQSAHRAAFVLFRAGAGATLHMAATWGGPIPVEFPTGEHETSFLTNPIRARDGFVEVPSGPGLGIEINEEAIRKHPYTAAAAKPFVLH